MTAIISAAVPNTIAALSTDVLLERLFRCMIFEHAVKPDAKLAATLNYLFTASAEQGRRQRGSFWVGAGRWGGESWGGGEIGTNTARLVLEELIIAGFEPQALLPVVRSCKYSPRKERAILSDEDGAIARLRASAASSRLFRKYRWNQLDSGFSAGFF